MSIVVIEVQVVGQQLIRTGSLAPLANRFVALVLTRYGYRNIAKSSGTHSMKGPGSTTLLS